jgi:hypothetical protein
MPPSSALPNAARDRMHSRFADEVNIVPLPYRGVSVQSYDGPMTKEALVQRFLGRETYRRTEFIVLRSASDRCAVIAVDALDRDPLFSPITHVEVLALPESCIYVRDPGADCGNRSALAAVADRTGVGEQETLVCEGKYDHVNFICRPRPFRLMVVEVAPPEPPKLYDLVRRVLDYADLPPILPVLERIDLTELARGAHAPAFLAPCRSGGLDNLGAPVLYLDERPERRGDWTLIGCERSLQFHRHFYGDEPPRIEMCPRVLAGERNEPTILKCCLWEFDVERQGQVMVVPWGADLAMVERALRALVTGGAS